MLTASTVGPLNAPVWWARLNIAKQFAIASFLVISVGMFGLGYWINSQIRQGVVNFSAASTAHYMASHVEPLVQDLTNKNVIDERTSKALDDLMQGPLKGKVMSVKIWHRDGSIAFSTFSEMVGKKFAIDGAFAAALQGKITTELGHTDSPESVKEDELDVAFLEVYSPLFDVRTGEIIGVGEFYLEAETLLSELRRQTVLTWGIVSALAFLMIASLSAIMFRASEMIDQQKLQLNERVSDLSTLLEANNELSNGIKQANKSALLVNDQLLNRLAADLHDGPAQLLAFVLLRLSGSKTLKNESAVKTTGKIRKAIQDALGEIRSISTGMNMPQLESRTIAEVLQLAVSQHEGKTQTKVRLKSDNLTLDVSPALKACLFRIVQEGLANAFKHGRGVGQAVEFRATDREMVLEVKDRGNGFSGDIQAVSKSHLGLIGLQNRVHVWGGTVDLKSAAGVGTCLTVRIPIEAGIGHHG